MKTDAPRHKSSQKERHLFAEQVRIQFANTTLGTVATLTGSIVLAFIVRKHVSLVALALWLVAALFVIIGRLTCNWYYQKSTTQFSNPAYWNNCFNSTIFLAGLLWGSTAIFLYPADSIGRQAFMAIIIGGMVAGASGVFSSIMTAFYLFSIPAISPIIGRFLMIGDEIHVAVGAMGILLLVLVSLAARRTHKNILHLLTLQYEREDLIDHLRHEVHQRKAAQADLHRQKEKVEEIVDQRTAQLIDTNRQLQKSEEKYRDLVENINDVIYAIDGDGKITYINPVIEKILGYRTDEMLGKNLCNFVHPEDQQQIQSDFALALRKNLEQREYRLLTKTGETRWCRISARPILENAKKSGVQGVLVDITASKLLEEQLVRISKIRLGNCMKINLKSVG